jgi:sporulation integral membrane protein YtvI
VQEYQRYVIRFIKIFFALVIIMAIYLFFSRFLVYLLPFVLAWIIASLINPIVNLLDNKTKIPRGIISALLVVLLVSIIILLSFLGVSCLITELSNMSAKLPQYFNMVRAIFDDLLSQGQNIYINLPDGFTQLVDSSFDNLIRSVMAAISNAIGKSLSIVTLFPKTLIFIIVTIMASYLISRDIKKIGEFISSQLPADFVVRLKTVELDLFKALGGFIRAQLTIMGITFIMTATGLYIIGIPYALTMALIIGLVDALPILGTGAIMVPWSLVNILTENYGIGFALLVLYAIIIITRQIIEPKIVGRNIGLHPLATLAALYIGIQLFGVIGVVLGPVIVILFKALQSTSIIPNWKKTKQP